jgi:excisionase family DNA binding protein
MRGIENLYVTETKHKVQQYYTMKEIAEMMRVSEKTVKRMIRDRELRAVKFRGSTRIPYSELIKSIKEKY